jgi:alkylated DNA repair dioxygenase AlkB
MITRKYNIKFYKFDLFLVYSPINNTMMESLVKDAPVYYEKSYVDEKEQQLIIDELSELPFDYHETRGHVLARKTLVMVLAEEMKNNIPTYWGDKVHVCKFTPRVEELRKRLSSEHKFGYNIVLLNMYDDGSQNINWHCDREEQGSTLNISSISIGAERVFKFKSKTTDENKSIVLESGSLLLMSDPCQDMYLHKLPKDYSKIVRMNLTFRKFKYTLS